MRPLTFTLLIHMTLNDCRGRGLSTIVDRVYMLWMGTNMLIMLL